MDGMELGIRMLMVEVPMKIKGIKKCYSMKNVREVAVRSGLDFSIRRYVALMIVFLSGLLLAGLLYRLELWYIVLVEVVGAAAIPPLIMYYYMQRCESKRADKNCGKRCQTD